MNARDKIFEQRSFDDETLHCPHCGWVGPGSDAHVAGFYGLSKFKEVQCPDCNEYLGNLSRDRSTREAQRGWDSQIGPI